MNSLAISNIISGLALTVSVAALWITHNFNRRQKSLIESQETLNRLYLEKEIQLSENERKAELGASFVRVGPKNSYRLKVWNKGKAAAKNVSIEFPNGNDIVPDYDLNAKFPLESLEPQAGVELIAVVHLGLTPKQVVKLVWDDGAGSQNEKIIHLTI
jgi:hypothetical protein